MNSRLQKITGEIVFDDLCKNCVPQGDLKKFDCIFKNKNRRIFSTKNEHFIVTVCSDNINCINSKSVLRREVESLSQATRYIVNIENEYKNRLSKLAHNLDKYAAIALQNVESFRSKINTSEDGIFNQVTSALSKDPIVWSQFVLDLYKTATSISIEIGAFRKLYGLESTVMEPHNIHRSTMNVVIPFQRALSAKNIKIQVHECFQEVEFDYQIYHAALFALIENCKKYCKEGSTIHIEFLTDKNQLTVQAKMISKKIEPDETERIFSGYYRARKVALGQLEGTGIGLRMARELLKKIGSNIRVEVKETYSDPDYGQNLFFIGPFRVINAN